MINPEEVTAVIFHALEALNAERGPEEQVEMSASTPLFGVDAVIDSLGFVSVITDVEMELNTEYGLEVSLTDDRAMSRTVSPYETVATLRDYILELIAS